MSDAILTLTEGSFEQDVLQNDKPVLVDFWATWCGPCKAIAPILEETAQEYDGKLVVGKVDVDENPELAVKYGVRGIPTLILFKGGHVEATKVGGMSKSQLSAFIDSHL